MEDDIDIEEHDLLENPVIKNIFPDLSILKKEISGYFEEASGIKKEPENNEQLKTQSQDSDACSDSNSPDSPYKQIKVLQNVSLESGNEKTALLGNKIILGSKPTQLAKNKLNDRGNQDLYAAKVYLNDIKSYLARSERFCEICLTIFPKQKDLEIHNTTVHVRNSMSNVKETKTKITIGSIVKKYKCNECSESFPQHSLLRRHITNIHRKKYNQVFVNSNQTPLQAPTPLRMRMVKAAKLNQCFHCKVSFSSKKLLIEHIYTVLQTNNGKGKSDPKPLKIEPQHKKNMKKTMLKFSRVITMKRSNIDSYRFTKSNNGYIKNTKLPIQCKKTEVRKRPEPIQRSIKKLQNNMSIFQCVYCSYIFSHMKFCLKHIINKHKDSSITEVKAIKFDEQCKYCSKKNCNWKLHNIHMQMYHKHKINGTIKVYPKICLTKVDHTIPKNKQLELKALIDNTLNVNEQIEMDFSEPLEIAEQYEDKEPHSVNNDQLLLKSILFKCKRCDIHFLSAKSAMNHADHMELLINWKCLSCKKIFKKVDEKLHMKQHSFCEDFTVCDLTESQLARILYKCTKCAIHFDANGYLSHLNKCEMTVAESIYCKVCDILIDKFIRGSHETYHYKKKLKSTDFTILNSDAIGAESVNGFVIKPVVKNSKNSKIKTYNTQPCLKLSYCKTCNSFISKKGRNVVVHIEARCAHLPTYICQLCGLIFTSKTMATHKIMHKERKGIRLQDFLFYSFRNSKLILPPVPEYPKCKSCHVHFISKFAVINHLCSEDFLTCHICNIKLSEPVFKLHMSFHYYSKTRKHEKDLGQTVKMHLNNTSETLVEKRRLSRPRPRKRDMSAPYLSMKLTEFCEPENNGEEANKPPSKKSLSDEMECVIENNFNKEDAKLVPENVSDECKLISNIKNSVQTYKTNQMHRKSDFALFNVLYCCINCRTTIDTYDAVVEHCQKHLCGVEIENKVCETCKIKLDVKSYENHNAFHALEAINTSFELLEFDTFYFSLTNSIWIKHVFQNVDDEKLRLILNRSIYKYGAKMKMQVIQEGSLDLTIYKCNSCFVIVDPDSLSKHVENSCFKTRKHPCSYCGLPFISYMSLKKHLNLHKKKNITLKSYRIVLINQEKDKKNNKLINEPNKYFLFYMCRNCNSVVDTYQRESHTLCDDKYLNKCSVCDLLFNNANYKAHMRKHELVCNFEPKNMKIVLFGQSPINKKNENPINQINFNGTIVDFTFIKCVKCGVCLEKSPIATLSHHTCYEETVISKCSKCELNILKTKFARHNKLHDINVHFVKENLNIIPYNFSEQLTKFIPADSNLVNNTQESKTQTYNILDNNQILADDCNNANDLNQINYTSPYIADTNLKISEKNAILLKCSCGLHFLDKTSIDEHFDHCNSEKSKQRCSKCNLLFTPTVLFTHLLLHHGDKNNIYKFKIIEMSKKQNHIITMYNCDNCKTIFLDYDKAKIHIENCKEPEADRKECTKCKLIFSSRSITQHETLHHDKKVADIEIVAVTTKNVYEDQRKADARSIETVIKQADLVRESKYNISDENLSQIDVSRYTNTVFKCETCNTHFLTHHTYRRHFANGKHVLPPQETCSFCELSFSLQSLAKHIYIHHKKMKLSIVDFKIQSIV